MAKATIKLPTELQKKLDNLEKQTDKITDTCLKAAAVPVKETAKRKFDQVVGHPHVVKRRGRLYNYGSRVTGTLRRSIGISPVMLDKNGNPDIKIGFADAVEPETGIRCGYLAAIIERGVLHGSRNQPPRPFIKPAEKASKAASLEAFERKFDEEVNKL